MKRLNIKLIIIIIVAIFVDGIFTKINGDFLSQWGGWNDLNGIGERTFSGFPSITGLIFCILNAPMEFHIFNFLQFWHYFYVDGRLVYY